MTSKMREAMSRMPDTLHALIEDTGPIARAVDKLHGRHVYLVGTGTSFNAAVQGEWLLSLANVKATAMTAADAVVRRVTDDPSAAIILLTHRGTKRYTTSILASARHHHRPIVTVSKSGNPDADVETCPEETTAAFTISHLCALVRLAQLAEGLGASLPCLPAVPEAVREELADTEASKVGPPDRMLKFIGFGINAATAREGSLKCQETSYIPSWGGNAEEFLHGPAVAVGRADTVVALDGGTETGRLDEIMNVVRGQGCNTIHVRRDALGEALSIFPLTVFVQKVAVQLAEKLGTNPDSFGKDLPGRKAAWSNISL